MTTTKSPLTNYVQQARMDAGLSVTDAAALIGASRRAWIEWEAGRRNCPPAKFALFEMYVATLPTLQH